MVRKNWSAMFSFVLITALILLLPGGAVAQTPEPKSGSPVDTGGGPSIQADRNWTWRIETVDNVGGTGSLGMYTSLVLDTDGYPHIVYFDDATGNLKYARWTGTTWLIHTVDSGLGTGGGFASLALDSNGHPHISYHDGTHDDTKYAHWTGTGWDIQVVDSSGGAGDYTSLALDSADRPHIVYSGWYVLKYAHWTGTRWGIETVDDASYVGCASLTIDNADRPHVSYPDLWYPNNFLKYAYRTSSGWSTGTGSGTPATTHTSLVLDNAGHPHISFEGVGGLYAHWTGTQWLVESAGAIEGQYSSIALDKAGHPCISTYDQNPNSELVYLCRDDTGWNAEVIDSNLGGPYTGFTSLALDAFDNPFISYYDRANKSLKLAWRALGKVISSPGGRLSTFDGHTIELPARAVTAPVILTYAPQSPTDTPFTNTDIFFDLSAVYQSTGQPAELAPGAHYTITIHYDESLLPVGVREEDLALFYHNGTRWVQEPTSMVNPAANTLTATPDHFSLWAVLGVHPPRLTKTATPSRGVRASDTVTYTLVISAPGREVVLWDPVPEGQQVITDSITGGAIYSATAKAILWRGMVPTDTVQVIQFGVTTGITGTPGTLVLPPLVNTAWVTDTETGRGTTAVCIVNGYTLYLPVVLKNY